MLNVDITNSSSFVWSFTLCFLQLFIQIHTRIQVYTQNTVQNSKYITVHRSRHWDLSKKFQRCICLTIFEKKQDLQVLSRCKSNFLNSIFITLILTDKIDLQIFKKIFESNKVMISLANFNKKLKQQNYKVSEKIAHKMV